jgi:hypothetical protein
MSLTLQVGDVVQLSPLPTNPTFAFCMMTVTDIKTWGAVGYVQVLGDNGNVGGQAYYRAKWEEMSYVGKAHYVTGGAEE